MAQILLYYSNLQQWMENKKQKTKHKTQKATALSGSESN